MKNVDIKELKGGDIYYIRGKVVYSCVSRVLEGEALQRNIERQKRNGKKYVEERPHTTITIKDATVLVKDQDNPTKAELYARDAIFQSTNRETGETTWLFTEKNVSKNPPRVLVKNPDRPNTYDEIKLERELAQGLDVTLIMSIYNTNKGNPGKKLDTIIVNEPIRYFNNDVIAQLEKAGITVNRMPEDTSFNGMSEVAKETPAPATQAPVQGTPVSPFANGQMNAQPAPAAPMGTPMTNEAPSYAAPQAPAAPATMAPPMGQAPTAPAAPAQTMPNPFADPYAVTDNSGMPGGLVYNADNKPY